MTYDAVLAARRGLGPADFRLARPAFLRAVRWALYAGTLSAGLSELRASVADDPPDSLIGAGRIAFMAARKAAREQLARLDRTLYPEDGDG